MHPSLCAPSPDPLPAAPRRPYTPASVPPQRRRTNVSLPARHAHHDLRRIRSAQTTAFARCSQPSARSTTPRHSARLRPENDRRRQRTTPISRVDDGASARTTTEPAKVRACALPHLRLSRLLQRPRTTSTPRASHYLRTPAGWGLPRDVRCAQDTSAGAVLYVGCLWGACAVRRGHFPLQRRGGIRRRAAEGAIARRVLWIKGVGGGGTAAWPTDDKGACWAGMPRTQPRALKRDAETPRASTLPPRLPLCAQPQRSLVVACRAPPHPAVDSTLHPSQSPGFGAPHRRVWRWEASRACAVRSRAACVTWEVSVAREAADVPWSGEVPDARARAGRVVCWSVRCAVCSGADSLAARTPVFVCHPPAPSVAADTALSRPAGCHATRVPGDVIQRQRCAGYQAAYRPLEPTTHQKNAPLNVRSYRRDTHLDLPCL